jgi:hypothetical protein
MRKVTDDLMTMAGKKPTGNWDVGPLKTEIRAAFRILGEGSFDKCMDATLNGFHRLYKAHPGTQEKLIGSINNILLAANVTTMVLS